MSQSAIKRVLAGLCTVGLLPAVLAGQANPPPEALARALQQRYEGIRDFSADFVQSYRGGVLRTQVREQGTVSVKKPGLMRWVYTSPERKEFVSDGRQVYFYVPEDRQVIVSNVAAADQATTPALFLAGRGDISRDFLAAYEDVALPGTTALRLTPLKPEPEYEYLVVSVDPESLQIRALTTRDRQGGESTIVFQELQENRGISDNEFMFRVPSDADVIRNDRSN